MNVKHQACRRDEPTASGRLSIDRSGKLPRPCDTAVAAFDFDGTITTSNSLRDFVRFTAGGPRLIYGALRAAPWFLGFLIGKCDRASAKAHFLAGALGGLTRPQLEAAAQRYATERLPELIRPEMHARIQEHKRLGHRLVLVSASLTLYLRIFANSSGFDAVLATELEYQGDYLSGRLGSRDCWGPEKVKRLQQWLGGDRPRVLFAYGNSTGDREMLALADHAWLRGMGAMPVL
ncbi:HAD family hydrolase [Paraburkholderia sp. RL17-373-BIF-A]|uniref:HAD family hydrolase n=1 Tax=Paraburkholderia sp. RL17-373-BIF-A TaxID=3031629 RepID=UPI0038BCA4F2